MTRVCSGQGALLVAIGFANPFLVSFCFAKTTAGLHIWWPVLRRCDGLDRDWFVHLDLLFDRVGIRFKRAKLHCHLETMRRAE